MKVTSKQITAQPPAPPPRIRNLDNNGGQACEIVDGQPNCPSPQPSPQSPAGGIVLHPHPGAVPVPPPAVEPNESDETDSSMPMLYTNTDLGIDINNDGQTEKVSTLLGMLSDNYQVSRGHGESQEDAESRVQAAIRAQYPEDQYPDLEIICVYSGDNTTIAFIPLNVPLALTDGTTRTLSWDNGFRLNGQAASPPPASGGPINIQPGQGISQIR